MILGEGGKVEIKPGEARKPAENPAKKGQPGAKVTRLPGGVLQFTIDAETVAKESTAPAAAKTAPAPGTPLPNKPGEKKEPGVRLQQLLPGGGFQVIIGEGGKVELKPGEKPAGEQKGPLRLGKINVNGGTLTITGPGTSTADAIIIGEGGKLELKSGEARKAPHNPPKMGEGVKVQQLPGGGIHVIIGEGGKVELKGEAHKPAENQGKKGEPGIQVQKLPGGGIQVIISEGAETKERAGRNLEEWKKAEAQKRLEQARHNLEEQMKSAKARMLERVNRQHQLAEQAWQLAQRLQAVEEANKAEAHAIWERLEAVEGQLRGTFQPCRAHRRCSAAI